MQPALGGVRHLDPDREEGSGNHETQAVLRGFSWIALTVRATQFVAAAAYPRRPT
jgi:hypothetical protein